MQYGKFFVILPTQKQKTTTLLEKEYNYREIAASAKLLWDPLIDEQRDLFVSHVSVRHLNRDDVLYHIGDTPKYLYYLIRGKIALYRYGLGEHREIVRMVEPGAIFGYVAAFDGSDYKSEAIAGTDTLVMQVPMRLVYHLIWENSNFGMLFLKELSSLLGTSVERTTYLTQKHIRGRLAEVLLRMHAKYGVEEDGQTLSVYLSRNELAKMSNMTTSNAIRTLSSFAQEGLIAIEGRRLKLIDLDSIKVVSARG